MSKFFIPRRQRVYYANQVAAALGLDPYRVPIQLERRSGFGGDVKLVSDCASGGLRIAYWPEGLKRLGNLIGAAPEELVIVGFVECLTFGILQNYWAQLCLNNCSNCRFRWPNLDHRLQNTLLNYHVTLEVLPTYRKTIDAILFAVCGDNLPHVMEELQRVRVEDIRVETVSFQFHESFEANLLFQVLKKYELLPPSYGAYYSALPPDSDSSAHITEASNAIHSAVRGQGDDNLVFTQIRAISNAVAQIIDKERLDYRRTYDREHSHYVHAYCDRAQHLPWARICSMLCRIPALRLPPTNIDVLPCVPLMGSGFLRGNRIYCSPTLEGDGGVVHEFIHFAVGNGFSEISLQPGTWARLGRTSGYTVRDYAEQAYVYFMEGWLRSEVTEFMMPGWHSCCSRNGFAWLDRLSTTFAKPPSPEAFVSAVQALD